MRHATFPLLLLLISCSDAAVEVLPFRTMALSAPSFTDNGRVGPLRNGLMESAEIAHTAESGVKHLWRVVAQNSVGTTISKVYEYTPGVGV